MSTPDSSNIVLRSDVDRPLLHGEMDLNFTELKNVIDQSNQNSSDVAKHYVTTRSLLTRSYADAGITVADGSFEQGVTGVTQGTGVYQESTGKVFQWQLTDTFNITAGTLPSNYGIVGTDWIDCTEDQLRDEIYATVRESIRRSYAEAGLNLVAGSFEEGGVLTSSNDVLLHKNSKNIYAWTDAFPKVVGAGSTPATTGGIGSGAWIDRTQDSLRVELSGGGSLAAPYSTILVDLPPYSGNLSLALDAATVGCSIVLGNRDYNIVGKYKLDTVAPPSGTWLGNNIVGLKIIGAGMPQLADDESRFISGSGTVIQGALINFADGFRCYDLAVDVGDYVVDTLASGLHMEGFVPGTHKLNTSWNDAVSAYINDVHFGNIKILLKQPVFGDSRTEKHCCLVERIDGGSHGFVECIGGTHGFVMKSRNIVPNGSVRAWRQTNDTAIFKTDTFTECGNYIGGNLVVGSKGHAIRSGQIQFQAANGTRFQNVKMDVKGVNWGGLGRVYDGATTPLEYVTIGNFMSDDTNATSITIPSIAINWKIGNHTIAFGPYGLTSESGCVGCHIGNGSVISCTGDGYRLAGDVQHSNLYAKANGRYGVYNNGAIINPELISGVGNANGLLSGLFGAGGLITRTNSWKDDGNGWYQPVLFGNKIKLSGQVKFGTADLFANITDGFRPKVNKTFTTTAYNGSAYVSLPVNILTSGNITIIGGASVVSSGGWIMLDGIEWSYI